MRDYNQLELEIDRMLIEDQTIQNLIITNNDQKIDSIEKRRDDIIKKNCNNCKNILDKYGYPTFEIVSKKTSHNFWILIQHCDIDIDLQKEALVKLKKAVKRGVGSKEDYAYLLDRVNINTGKKQVFGTQVYRSNTGKYMLYPTKDSLNLNHRRKKYGFKWTVEEYLEFMNKL